MKDSFRNHSWVREYRIQEPLGKSGGFGHHVDLGLLAVNLGVQKLKKTGINFRACLGHSGVYRRPASVCASLLLTFPDSAHEML